MLAVDTNVVVRYLTDDDPGQALVARKLIADRPFMLLTTVALETEWVLRSLYRFRPSDICLALQAFTQLPNTRVEDTGQVQDALDWFAQGMDFADALHLAGCSEDDALATFDRKLVAAARKVKAGKVKAL